MAPVNVTRWRLLVPHLFDAAVNALVVGQK
jgi:hypothetical protein